jgi:hypothetical protein
MKQTTTEQHCLLGEGAGTTTTTESGNKQALLRF